MENEERSFVRVHPHPRRPVTIQIKGKDFLETFQVVDISVGDVGVRVPHSFDGHEINEEVEVVLSLPGEAPLRTRGTIRNVRKEPGGSVFGVQFSQLSAGHRGALETFVEHRLSEGEVPSARVTFPVY